MKWCCDFANIKKKLSRQTGQPIPVRVSYTNEYEGYTQSMEHVSGTSQDRSSAPRYDRFGFLIRDGRRLTKDNHANKTDSESHKKKCRRLLSEWDMTSDTQKKKFCRLGIPQQMRGQVWKRLLNTPNLKDISDSHPNYASLKDEPLDSKVSSQIEKDLDRTFPSHIMFQGNGAGRGKEMLRNVLHAYARCDASFGYCQGLGFLVATLLIQLKDEEDTFRAFYALMEHSPYQMKGLFKEGFPQLYCCSYIFGKLLKAQNKTLFNHLKRCKMSDFLLGNGWFQTIFTKDLEASVYLRVWDMFLCEGWKPLYRVVLSLFLMRKKQLLAEKTETNLFEFFSRIESEEKSKGLVEHALSIKFWSKKISEYTAEFQKTENVSGHGCRVS